MKNKPVAWMYHYPNNTNHKFALTRSVAQHPGWIEVPLYTAPRLPEGVVMVPRELTKRMHDAIGENIGHAMLEWVWKQLLSAAGGEDK